MKHTTSYINSMIETPTNLPKNILGILGMLADYDNEGNNILYFDRLDDLWVNAKNAIAAGVMSKRDWIILEEKYWLHAEMIYSKEKENENI